MLPGLAAGLMWSLLLAAIALAIASFSGRRACATGAVAVNDITFSWSAAATTGGSALR